MCYTFLSFDGKLIRSNTTFSAIFPFIVTQKNTKRKNHAYKHARTTTGFTNTEMAESAQLSENFLRSLAIFGNLFIYRKHSIVVNSTIT